MKIRSLKDEDYELINSLIIYKEGNIYNRSTGRKYGSTNSAGYVGTSISISGLYKIRDYNHRFIFLLHHKYLPHHVDHIDRDKSNNVINNLRAATSSENGLNCKVRDIGTW